MGLCNGWSTAASPNNFSVPHHAPEACLGSSPMGLIPSEVCISPCILIPCTIPARLASSASGDWRHHRLLPSNSEKGRDDILASIRQRVARAHRYCFHLTSRLLEAQFLADTPFLSFWSLCSAGRTEASIAEGLLSSCHCSFHFFNPGRALRTTETGLGFSQCGVYSLVATLDRMSCRIHE